MKLNLENSIYKENIILNLKSITKEEVIQQLSKTLWDNGFIRDVNEFVGDVRERESQMTTGIGNGLAIPHGKSNSVLESTMIFAKTKNEIEWNSLDEKPVNIVFLLAIANKDGDNEHLKLLADISGKLMDDNFVEAIRKAKTSEEIKKLLLFQN